VKINGQTHYPWRAVDHEGEALESFVTKDRNKAAALKFIKKAMRRHGSPKAITTDGLRSYKAAMRPSHRRQVAVRLTAPISRLRRAWWLDRLRAPKSV